MAVRPFCAAVVAAALLAVAACRPTDAAPPRAPARAVGVAAPADTAAARPPSYTVDSILPIDEAVRRFRAGLPVATRLEGGAASREQLVRRFVRAVAHGDTAALRRMELNRSEFAYLVYPSSPYTRAPYRQQPEIAWMLLRQGGATGEHRLVERLAGRPLAYLGHSCDPAPAVEGENRLWRACRVRVRRADGTVGSGALFGVVIERDGRFKFASYANDI